MIITRFGRDLPDGWPGLCTPRWSFFRLRRETEGPQGRIRESLTAVVAEPHQTNRKRNGFLLSPSGWPQKVGPALEVL